MAEQMPESRNSVQWIRHALRTGDEAVRWEAADQAGILITTRPEVAWALVVEFGRSKNADVRAAIATCVLEHLLEHEFDEYFTRLEAELATEDPELEDTFTLCWKFGVAEYGDRMRRWQKLRRMIEKRRTNS